MSFVPGHLGPGTQLVLNKYRVIREVHRVTPGEAGSRWEEAG